MPPKKANKGASAEEANIHKPLPTNIFLYIQLAQINNLPNNHSPLELHLYQGGSLIIKCEEHYNTDGIIKENEFDKKPTYTLVFQQDNLDRINHAADNPLLIKLYMGWQEEHSRSDIEDTEMSEETDMLNYLYDQIEKNSTESVYSDSKEEMRLLCVGYLDVIKLFGNHRVMLREELLLYPVPECPIEYRYTVKTEWHLYILAPIAKEVTFTNMAFVIFESIYNIKEDYIVDVDSLSVQLSFRSTVPGNRNEYHVIPLCTYSKFTESCIKSQVSHHVFEYFRNNMPNSNCIGLKSVMEVQGYTLFNDLFRSEDMIVDFDLINKDEDSAFVCNTFHRYILTKNMSDILFEAIVWRRYVIAVDVFSMVETEKKGGKTMVKTTALKKVFSGTLDPAILIYPDVQKIRFAVELKYLGENKKIPKSKIGDSITSMQRDTTFQSEMPTFAIINICLLTPLGQTNEQLKNFRESFIDQDRLLYCERIPIPTPPLYIKDIQKGAYSRFDEFMRDTIRYIFEKNVFDVSQKRNFFCCSLQNLTNILMKIVGCDFNMRERTHTNVEFTNLCTIAFNELEERIHNLLEGMEAEGLHRTVSDVKEDESSLTDHLNAIKILRAVGDTRMANVFFEKAISLASGYYKDNHFISRTDLTNSVGTLFQFFDLISKMEKGDYATAKLFFEREKLLSNDHKYYSGWIHIYLDFVATRDDPDPTISDNSNECLLKSIFNYTESYETVLDGWILLFCYYKRFNYAPGYSYARWRLENNLKKEAIFNYLAPYSLWGISMNINPIFEHERSSVFFRSFKVFVRLGLYEFAEVIWEDIQNDCGPAESYFITTQLKILLNKLEEDFELTTFQFDEPDAEDLMISFNAQLNGNVEYYRGNYQQAAKFYELNLQTTDVDSEGRDNFMLSKMRLAYISFEAGNYQMAIDAVRQSQEGKLIPLVCNYLIGKAYYKMGDLERSMEAFVSCTSCETHVPDVWGFLALINLQMNNNMNALTCWKYANADPTKRIRDETIYEELDMIDVDTVDLYIDMPSPDTPYSSIEDEDEN